MELLSHLFYQRDCPVFTDGTVFSYYYVQTRVEEEHINLDPRISFLEIDRYFLSGCACAFFQVATDVYTDLRYNQEEWD